MFNEGEGLAEPKGCGHLLAMKNAALRSINMQTITFIGGPRDGTTMNVSKVQPVMTLPYCLPGTGRRVGPPFEFTPPFPEFRTLWYRQSRLKPCRYIFDEKASDIPKSQRNFNQENDVTNETKDLVLLGGTYRDRVTGIEGVATARTDYLTACTRVLLEVVKDGEVKDCWFDDLRLSQVGDDVVSFAIELPSAKTGGSAPSPPSRDPS